MMTDVLTSATWSMLIVALVLHTAILWYDGTYKLANAIASYTPPVNGSTSQHYIYWCTVLAGYLLYSIGIALLPGYSMTLHGSLPTVIYSVRLITAALETNGRLPSLVDGPSIWLKTLDIGLALIVLFHIFAVL